MSSYSLDSHPLIEADHPFRLRRIELKNFKSAVSTGTDLLPLSVVVGVNSSGKSTLFQAVLATCQAIRMGDSPTDLSSER